MKPCYIASYESGKLQQAVEHAHKMLASCSICPRMCKVNRLKNELGYCKTGANARVCSYMPHHGEEPPISGVRGSGTIFFSHCNMSCVYCQNYEFSQLGQGREVRPDDLADIMLELQGLGCHNINLVSPTHILPQILAGLALAIPKGLDLPLVYNTGGYELPGMIKLLENIVDIYLPDMRYAREEIALKYSFAPGYPKHNQASVKEMQRQAGVARMDNQGIIERGLIIRHLVLPNNVSGTEEVMRFIANEVSPETYVSLMSQYLPYYQAKEHQGICRRLFKKEYEEAEEIMHKYGLYNGWIQESYGLERFAGVHIKPNLKADGE